MFGVSALTQPDATLLESLFDPMELMGSRMPFVDPFGHDYREFQASSRVLQGLANPYAVPTQPFSAELSQESLILPRIICQGALTALSRPEAHLDSKLVYSNRIKLTPDQAISIFNQRKTKTKRTASLLSAKYGVSSKAIRDIFTGRSWGHYTRPPSTNCGRY
jgi:hypothetical protein